MFQSKTIIKDGVVISGDLFQEIDDVLIFITKHINKEFIITGNRNGRPRTISIVLREIVINMIVLSGLSLTFKFHHQDIPGRIEFITQGS